MKHKWHINDFFSHRQGVYGRLIHVILPILLLVIAVGVAGLLTYGCLPQWIELQYGLGVILFSARWQWALVAISLLACLILVGLVVAGRSRIWWLFGLAPVLALFIYHFTGGPLGALRIVTQPRYIAASEANILQDSDWVAGVFWNGQAYAYPYRSLYSAPVVVTRQRDHRMILFWSPYADQITAFDAGSSLNIRQLRIVSMPANALLLYDSRTGQFINGLTGLMPDDSARKPDVLGDRLVTGTMRWGDWRALYPKTLLLSSPLPSVDAPGAPILPRYPAPVSDSAAQLVGASAAEVGQGGQRVTLVGGNWPVAVVSDQISDAPSNLVNGAEVYFIFLDKASHTVRAFDRVLPGGLYPRFSAYQDPHQPMVAFKDADTGSLWTRDGLAVQGQLKGTQLKRVPVWDRMYWNIAKYWYPDLKLVYPAQ